MRWLIAASGSVIVALRRGGRADEGLHGAAAIQDDMADLLAGYGTSIFRKK